MVIPGSFTKITAYFAPTFNAISRVISSTGQSFFAMTHVAEYFFKDNKHAKRIIPSISISGCLGVNLLTRVPALYCNSFANEEFQLPQEYKHGYLGTSVYYLLMLVNHASNYFFALNAYLGSEVLCESLASFFDSDAHDKWWKEILIQITSILVVCSVIKTYYVYDYKINRINAHIIANRFDEKDFHFDKSAYKTLAICSFSIITAPILTKFWIEPAILKIPFVKKIVPHLCIEILAWFASGISLMENILISPSVHAYFEGDPHTVKETGLIKFIRGATVTTGIVDSLSAGLCTFVAIMDTGEDVWHLNRYGYLIALAVPAGISYLISNAMFSIRPGYIELIQKINAKQQITDEENLLIPISEENEAAEIPTQEETLFFSNKRIGLFFSHANTIAEDLSPTQIAKPHP